MPVRRIVRCIPELRAVEIERHLAAEETEVLVYRSLRWDLGSLEVPPTCHRLGLRTWYDEFIRNPAEIVEIPEPLWVRRLPFIALVAASAKVGSRGRARVVMYAMENNDVRAVFGLRGVLGALAFPVFKASVGAFVAIFVDRIAFASDQARFTYESLPWSGRNEAITVLALPRKSERATTSPAEQVLFVGQLEERKGLSALMAAWEQVEAVCPEAKLSIAGSGELENEVSRWAGARPKRRHFLGFVDHRDMPNVYNTHRVLAAPSQRYGRWREQIGLPIKEALSHGLTVVTSTETGLASWLEEHHHQVFADPSELRDRLVTAISAPLTTRQVQDSLPTVDGRKAANDWLHDRRGNNVDGGSQQFEEVCANVG